MAVERSHEDPALAGEKICTQSSGLRETAHLPEADFLIPSMSPYQKIYKAVRGSDGYEAWDWKDRKTKLHSLATNSITGT